MRSLWIAIAILLFFSACTKIESTSIGSGLIPPIDGVNTFDTTLEVITDNFLSKETDSVQVKKGDDHVIGIINNDPYFGSTTAETYFELKPTSYKFAIPGEKKSIAVDSAVLILSYKGVWGDSMVNQNWEVHEVTELLRNDTTFAVYKNPLKGALLGSQTVDLRGFNDSVKNRYESASNQIRITLSADFARKLILQYDSSSNTSGAYFNDSLFRQNFKGFSVSPAAGSPGNALVRVNLLDSNTKLGLYYKYKATDTSKLDTSVSYFRFSTGSTASIPVSASGNHIVRSRGGSQMGTYLANGNPSDDRVFIQTSPGSYATIKIPGLESLSNRIVHRAELMVVQDPEYTELNDKFTPPSFLLLNLFDADQNKLKRNIPNDFIIDQSSGPNISTFGGYLINRELPGGVGASGYFFDISRYVQGIVTRKDPSYTLALSAPTNDTIRYSYPYPSTLPATTYSIVPSGANNAAIGRVVLRGGGIANGSPVRMRLRIIYSRI